MSLYSDIYIAIQLGVVTSSMTPPHPQGRRAHWLVYSEAENDVSHMQYHSNSPEHNWIQYLREIFFDQHLRQRSSITSIKTEGSCSRRTTFHFSRTILEAQIMAKLHWSSGFLSEPNLKPCFCGGRHLPEPHSEDVRDDERREEDFEELGREDSSLLHHTSVPDTQGAGAFGLLQQELPENKKRYFIHSF